MGALEIASLFGTLDLRDNATQALKGFGSGIDDAESKLKSIGGSLTSFGVQLTAITAPITAFLGTSLKAFSEMETTQAQLAAVLKSTGGAAGVTAQQVDTLALSLSKVTRYSDDTVLGAENLLLTFTSIGKDVFPDATKTVLDMSTALGQDLKSSAIQLGKALQDPIAGVTALKRVGVNFSESQMDMIKSMVKSNNLLGAQTLILKELQKEFGGSAEAAGNTFAGKLDILSHRFESLQQSVGHVLADALTPFLQTVGDLVDRVAKWADSNADALKPLVLIGGALVLLGPLLIAAGLAISAIGTAVGLLGTALGVLLGPVGLVIAALALLKRAYDTNFLGFKDTVDRVVTQIGSALQLIPFYAGYYLGKIWSTVQPLLQPLLNWFSGTGSDSFGGAVTSAYNTVIKPAIDNLSKLLGGIWAAVGPALGTLLDWFQTTGLPFIQTVIQSTLDNFIKPLIDTISGIWTAIQPGLQSAFDWFTSSGLPAIGGFINDALNNAVLPFINTLIGLWRSVSGPLNDFMSGIKNVFGWVVDNVIAPMVAGIQEVIDIINRLRGVSTGTIQKAPGSFPIPLPGQPSVQSPAAYDFTGMSLAQINASVQGYNYGAGIFPTSFTGTPFPSHDYVGSGRAGQPYLIGKGAQPELFVPQTSGTFYPRGSQQGGGGGVQMRDLHLYFPNVVNLDDPQVVEQVVEQVLIKLATP